jgi:hypothetical protein
MTNQTENEEVELETREQTYWVKQYEALSRLEKTEDFKTLILDGYFKEAAARKVSLLARDDIKRSGARGDVMEALIAISHLQDHLFTVKNIGSIAQDDALEAEFGQE